MNGVKMTSGSEVRKSKYGLNAMEVGDIRTFNAPTKEEQKRIRRAAHNRNARSKKYFITRCKGDVLYITRVR
jgi:hypothetical protein